MEALKDVGAQVYGASNGEEALVFLNEQCVDAILSDIRMPKMDGVTLLRSLKEKHKRDGTKLPPFFFLSGYSDLTEGEAQQMGARALLNKPFRLEVIYQHLQSVR